jgi:putative transcriptional regulator
LSYFCYSTLMSNGLNNCISEKRQTKSMTQEALAQTVGVTRQTVIAIEKGNYTPSVALALKLAVFFNSSVEELFWYD